MRTTMTRVARFVGAALVLLSCAQAACAKVSGLSFPETFPVTLSKPDQALLEQTVCQTAEFELASVVASTEKKDDGKPLAWVRCVAKLDMPRRPLYTERCRKLSTGWDCVFEQKGYVVEVNGNKLDLFLDADMPIELAHSTLQKIGNAWFQGQSVAKLIRNGCTALYPGRDSEIEYDCGWHANIAVSLFCPKDTCPRILWID